MACVALSLALRARNNRPDRHRLARCKGEVGIPSGISPVRPPAERVLHVLDLDPQVAHHAVACVVERGVDLRGPGVVALLAPDLVPLFIDHPSRVEVRLNASAGLD